MTNILGDIGMEITADSKSAVSNITNVSIALKAMSTELNKASADLASWTKFGIVKTQELEARVGSAVVRANETILKARVKTQQISDSLAAKTIASMAGVSRASSDTAGAEIKRLALVERAESVSVSKRVELRKKALIEMKSIEEQASIDSALINSKAEEKAKAIRQAAATGSAADKKAASKVATKIEQEAADQVIAIMRTSAEQQRAIWGSALEARKQAALNAKAEMISIEESYQAEMARISEAARLQQASASHAYFESRVEQGAQAEKNAEKAMASRRSAKTRVMNSGYSISRAGDQAIVGGAITAVPYVLAAAAATKFQDAQLKAANNTDLTAKEVGSLTENVKRLIKEGTNHDIDKLFASGMRASNFRKEGQTAAETFHIMKVAADAATATFSDVEDTTTALAREMFLFNIPTKDASRVMNMMEVAAAHNNLTLEQMVKNSGRLLAFGSELKLPMQEQIAAYALLTKHGFSAGQATTALSAAERGLAGATASTQKKVAELEKAHKGISSVFSAHNLQVRGLVGTLKLLHDTYHLNQQQIIDLFPDYRKNQALLVLLGSGYQELIEGVKQANQAWDENIRYQRNLESVHKSVSYQLNALKNQVYLLGATASKDLIPQLIEWIKQLDHLIQYFQNLDQETKDSILTISKMGATVLIGTGLILKFLGGIIQFIKGITEARTAIVALTLAFRGMAAAEGAAATAGAIGFAAAGPWGLAIAAAALAVGGIVYAWQMVQKEQDRAAQGAKDYAIKSQAFANQGHIQSLQVGQAMRGTEVGKLQTILDEVNAMPDGKSSFFGVDRDAVVRDKLQEEGFDTSNINYSSLKGLTTRIYNLNEESRKAGDEIKSYMLKRQEESKHAKALSAIDDADAAKLGDVSCAYWASKQLKKFKIPVTSANTASILASNATDALTRDFPDRPAQVPATQAQRGDLIYWSDPRYGGKDKNGNRSGHHVGMSLGNGMVQDAEHGQAKPKPLFNPDKAIAIKTSYYIAPNSAWSGMPGYMNNRGGNLDMDPFGANGKSGKGRGMKAFMPTEMKYVNPSLEVSNDVRGKELESEIATIRKMYETEIAGVRQTGIALDILRKKRKESNDLEAASGAITNSLGDKYNTAVKKQADSMIRLHAAVDHYNTLAAQKNELESKAQSLAENGTDKKTLDAMQRRVQTMNSLLAIADAGTKAHPELGIKALTENAQLAKSVVEKLKKEMLNSENAAATFQRQVIALDGAIEKLVARQMQENLTNFRNSGKAGVIGLGDEQEELRKSAISSLSSSGIIGGAMADRGDLSEIKDFVDTMDTTGNTAIADQYTNLLKIMKQIKEIQNQIDSRSVLDASRTMTDRNGDKNLPIGLKRQALSDVISGYASQNGLQFDSSASHSDEEAIFGSKSKEALALLRLYYEYDEKLSNESQKRNNKEALDNDRVDTARIVRLQKLGILSRDTFLSSMSSKSKTIAEMSLGSLPDDISQSDMLHLMQDKVTSDNATGIDPTDDIKRRDQIVDNIRTIQIMQTAWIHQDKSSAKEWERTWKEATRGVRDAMVNGLTDILTESQDKGKALHKMIDDIFKSILKTIIKKFVTDALDELEKLYKKPAKTPTGVDLATVAAGSVVTTATVAPGDVADVPKLKAQTAESSTSTKRVEEGNVASGTVTHKGPATVTAVAQGANAGIAAVNLADSKTPGQVIANAASLVNSVPTSALVKTLGSGLGGALTKALPYIGAAMAVAQLFGMFGSGKRTPSRSRDEEFHKINTDISPSADSGYSGYDSMRGIIGSVLASRAGVQLAATGGYDRQRNGAAGTVVTINNPQFNAHGIDNPKDFIKSSIDELGKQMARQNKLRDVATGFG